MKARRGVGGGVRKCGNNTPAGIIRERRHLLRVAGETDSAWGRGAMIVWVTNVTDT